MMKKQPPKTSKNRVEKAVAPSLRISYILVLLAYTLIPVIIPNLEAIDSNGPKFLFLSISNLLCFLFLLTTSQQKNEPGPIRLFFSNKIGFTYTLLMAVILLSFTKAINMGEAFITFSMYFSVFAAALNLSVILRSDKRYLRLISIVLAFVLIVDSLTVFFNILLYITKQIRTIEDIKSVFSNKNIFAAAIFIKMAFALWLITFETGWVKKLGYISLCCAFVAIFFMSARAFYFGTFLLVMAYVVFILILNHRNKTPQPFKTPGLVFGAFIMALLIFTMTQRYLYPKNGDKYNVSLTQRVSQVNEELSDTWRIGAWKNSATLFKKDPLLGVGTGNWKIRVLEYENKTKNHATYMVRNHNDFIQVTTETGIFGGLLFISIFVLIGMNFLLAFFKRDASEDSFKYLFIPAFGIVLCGIDAFFNFPSERPEIQSLFALLVAAGIAYAPAKETFSFVPFTSETQNSNSGITLTRAFVTIYILILAGSSYVFTLYYKSQKMQTLMESDIVVGAFRRESKFLLANVPVIPTVSTLGIEPLVVTITRYMLMESKVQESIELLRPDRSSPWDSRREFNLAFAFDNLGIKDSALFYARKAVELRPRFYVNVNVLCNLLTKYSTKAEAIQVLQEYLAKEKFAKEPWLKLSALYRESGDTLKADNAISEAIKYLPWEKDVILKMAGKK